MKELNKLYRNEPALYQVDDDYSGFEWIDFRDTDESVISFIRYSRNRQEFVVFCGNFTPVPRHGYRVGVPQAGLYREILNTDAAMFGGSNMGNGGSATTEKVGCHGRPASLRITLPPLSMIAFKL